MRSGWMALCVVAMAVTLALAQASLFATAESAMQEVAVEADGNTVFIEQNAVAESEAEAEADTELSTGAATGSEAEADWPWSKKKKNRNNNQAKKPAVRIGKDGKPLPPPTKPKQKKKKDKKPKRPPYMGGNVQFNRAMDVRGVLSAGSMMAQNATVQGTLIARQIKTKHIRTTTLSAGELKTTRLSSPTGTIVIEGDLLITHSRKLEFPKPPKVNSTKLHKKGSKKKGDKDAAKKVAKGVSFLAEEVVVGGVKQWALVRQEHFQHPAEGWYLLSSNEPFTTTTSCGDRSTDRFLGGHCALADGPIRKFFSQLPPHQQVRITARVHFIDNWTGETAFAQADGQYIWSQSHSVIDPTAALQLCGDPMYPESRMSAPIDVSLPHTGEVLTLNFGVHSRNSGSTTNLQKEQEVACSRSFGIDDVAIWVR